MDGIMALRKQHKGMTMLLQGGKPYHGPTFRAVRAYCNGCAIFAPATLAAWEHFDYGPRGSLSEEIAGIRGANGIDLAMNRRLCIDVMVRNWAVLNKAYPSAMRNRALLYGSIALEDNDLLRNHYSSMTLEIDECREILEL